MWQLHITICEWARYHLRRSLRTCVLVLRVPCSVLARFLLEVLASGCSCSLSDSDSLHDACRLFRRHVDVPALLSSGLASDSVMALASGSASELAMALASGSAPRFASWRWQGRWCRFRRTTAARNDYKEIRVSCLYYVLDKKTLYCPKGQLKKKKETKTR